MKHLPILFNTEMVKAILEGRKTQTRRVVKSKHESGLFEICKNMDGQITSINSLDWDESTLDNTNDIKPKACIGHIFWVRETWQITDFLHVTDDNYGYIYKASENGKDWEENSENWKWKPSIFMPKVACRIFLKVTKVRVERLHDISEEDAIAEGVKSAECNSIESCIGCRSECQAKGTYWDYLNPSGECGWPCESAKESFFSLWESINGKESLDSNPWVFVYDFELTEKPKNFLNV